MSRFSCAARFLWKPGCIIFTLALILGLFWILPDAQAVDSSLQKEYLNEGFGLYSSSSRILYDPIVLLAATATPRPTKTPTVVGFTASPSLTLTNTQVGGSTPTKTPRLTKTPVGETSSTPTQTKTPTLSATPTTTSLFTPTSTLTKTPTGSPTPTTTQPSPGNSPVAHWKFDEASGTSAADSSGNGFTGTLVNSPAWTSGHLAGALSFDGTNDYVTTVDDPLDLTGSLTISAWIYHTNNSTAHHIVSKNQNKVATPWQLAILTSNKLRSYTRGNNLDQMIDSNNVVSLNTWHHVVFIRDSSTSKVTFFIDGMQDSGGWKTYTPDRVSASAVTAKIGTRGDALSNFFPGTIDDLRLYDRALNAAEVQALYQGEPGGEVSVSITSPANGSTVSGTVAVDVSASAESGISQVDLYKNGSLIASDSLVPYTFLWSTALEPNGSYTLAATAFDASGGSENSTPVNLIVNNSPVTARPNIVVVLTDDQRWDTMQYMPITNALLFPEAIRFNNAIAAVPLCCPSRSTIFTGLYSYNHGIIDNMPPYGGATLFDDSSTIATWLDAKGYRTGLFGKYLNNYIALAPYVPPGWDEWHAFVGNNSNYYTYNLVENGVTVNYGGDPEDYSTDLLTAKAIDFITTTAPSDPVFVYLALFAPHFNEDGGTMDSLPVPGPGDDGAYASLPPWRPSSFNEADVTDKPTWVRNLPLMTAEQVATGDQFRIQQLESLLAVDRAIGDLISTLQQMGRYENTVFVFLSDNGLSWGEHRWNWRKWCSYEECVRIPFLIRVPGVSGRDDNSLVNDVDLAPTLAELAGALPPSRLDGLSMLDLIENPSSPWRTEAYTEYISPWIGGAKMVFREIRTDTYMYAEYDNGDREFYDLTIDPLEELNQVNNPLYADIVDGLQRLLQILRD